MQLEHVDLGSVEIPLVQRHINDVSKKDCKIIADSLAETGLVKIVLTDGFDFKAIGDARVMIDAYTDQPEEFMREDERAADGHEVGYRPPGTEIAHAYKDIIAQMKPEHRPLSAAYERPPPDKKRRYFITILPHSRPIISSYPQLNRRRDVIPKRFPDWERVMARPGLMMYDCMMSALTMAGMGFGEGPEFFTELLYGGPHLFGPTICHPLEEIQAAGHRDIGAFTGHFQSTYPGAIFWTRKLLPFSPKLKENEVLIQAADQAAAITGGVILDGFHEVSCPQDAAFKERVLQWEADYHKPAKRIAFPFFFHARSEAMVGPRGRFRTPEAMAQYPDICAGEKVWSELHATTNVNF